MNGKKKKERRRLSRSFAAVAVTVAFMAGACRHARGAATAAEGCTEVRFIEEGTYWSAQIFVGRDGLPFLLVLDDTNILFVHCEDDGCLGTISRTLAQGVQPTGVSFDGGHSVLPGVTFRRRGSGPSQSGNGWLTVSCRDDRCSGVDQREIRRAREERPCTTGILVQPRCDEGDCPEQPKAVSRASSAVVASSSGRWIFEGTEAGVGVKQCSDKSCREGARIPTSGRPRMLTGMTAYDGSTWLAILDDSTLRIAACRDGQCLDHGTLPGQETANSLATIDLAPDGLPVVLLHDIISGESTLVRCADAGCSSLAARQLGIGKVFGFAIGRDGRPLFVSGGPDQTQLRVLRCTDADCSAVTSATVALTARSSPGSPPPAPRPPSPVPAPGRR
ncbi:MAG TPA: hypothetical protein VJ276_05045 [Thermoanaerobaculia bacterium]|nr:hypothetical protein [Thermoanaerobaculia bacterium]